MKRSMVVILALTVACSTLLSGCGEKQTKRPASSPTAVPEVTLAPEVHAPAVEDGVVNDDDGILTDDDNDGKVDVDGTIHAGQNELEGDSQTVRP